MQQVVSPIPRVQKILGSQKVAGGTPCRLSAHCMRVEQPAGVLMYHTLTGELLLLSAAEAEALEGLPGPVPPALGELAARWFLRPLEADDMAMAEQVREIEGRFARKKKSALTGYTIFTTMDCNARCFYCYEAGWKRSSMSKQTALDTAKYIAVHCGGKPVRIEWFGGEPLVNTRAIDVITDSLRREKVEFRSTMISNGYLFDEALVQRARDVWNLFYVQIALDGTEEIYNRRKAYVNSQDSPFQRVLRNIGMLLDAGIRVKARLNMDGNNEVDLYALVDELADRFGGKTGFGVYTMVLQENAGVNPTSYTEEERRAYAQKFYSLQAYVEEKGIAARMPLKRGFVAHACMADDDSFTTVTPEGGLGRCESCIDSSVWGNVCSDESDEVVLQQWRERNPSETACKTCPVYPQCIRLKKCPGWAGHCTPIQQSYNRDVLRRAVLGAYEDWKTAEQNRQEE